MYFRRCPNCLTPLLSDNDTQFDENFNLICCSCEHYITIVDQNAKPDVKVVMSRTIFVMPYSSTHNYPSHSHHGDYQNRLNNFAKDEEYDSMMP